MVASSFFSYSFFFPPRTRYLVHGFNLRLYVELGMKIKRLHRGISFHQAAFTRDFVNECTTRRMRAQTVTEQTMWKLIVCSVYGKVRVIQGWFFRF